MHSIYIYISIVYIYIYIYYNIRNEVDKNNKPLIIQRLTLQLPLFSKDFEM